MSLFVYRSSAGSGKTTALVNEYLKIALKNPTGFRHILAITFTNKAAAEMKSRILEAIKDIASGNQFKNEYRDLFNSLALTGDEVLSQAKLLQSLILHHYDDFAISTIDSFVHGIIRTFATDVKLPKNFEVVIDEEDFVPEIVSDIFAKVGVDEALTEIMVNFIMAQTKDEKSYNVGHLLGRFIKKQIGEEGFHHLQKIDRLTTSDFVNIIRKLNKKRTSVNNKIINRANDALDLIHTNGLGKDDFYQTTRGIYGYFFKATDLSDDKVPEANNYVKTTINDNKWTSSKADLSSIEMIEVIKDELENAFQQIESEIEEYIHLKLIYKKIYALALTHEIRAVFNDFTERTQKVHISEFSKRISTEIRDQPVPFIYERLGRKYKYFLIDEFQDTSVLQWQNLLPLIEESLAHGNDNMLVGDAKQAIYRFRNGDVELFVNLPGLTGKEIATELETTELLLKSHYKEVQLDMNWRSEKQIIQFNNEFFDDLKSTLSLHNQQIYADHHQQLPEEKSSTGGFVSIGFIETNDPEEYASLRLSRIKSQIEKLLSKGFQQKDICVLTRTNSSAIEISTYLIENNFDVISSESLLLTNSPEVRLIIALENLLLNPTELVNLAEFIVNLQQLKNYKLDFHLLFEKVSEKLNSGLDTVFEILGLDLKIKEISELTAYEFTEYAIRKLGLNQTANIYLHYFLDFVFESQENSKSSLMDFMVQWELKKNKLFITMPDEGDAIKVMTVHKAKGLKFEVVITDLTQRGTRKNKTEFWTNLDVPGFEELEVGLLPINKELAKIGLGDVAVSEDEKSILDLINIVYVAFTRAVSTLIVTGNITDSSRKDLLTGYLVNFLKNKGLYHDQKDEYQFGELNTRSPKHSKDKGEVIILDKLISSSWKEQVIIAGPDKIYWDAIGSKPAREYGNLIHGMLAKIYTADEVERVVKSYEFAGIIDESEAEEIISKLKTLVYHPELEKFFQKGVIVKNELDVLCYGNEGVATERPDRVIIDGSKLAIIDYKTGTKEKGHFDQINEYAKVFNELGYASIDKKLVYIDDSISVVSV